MKAGEKVREQLRDIHKLKEENLSLEKQIHLANREIGSLK